MNTLEMAADHYNIGYVISGDRKCITPTKSFCYHAGDVSLCAPYIYRKTTALTDKPYESILIKFSPKFAEPFIQEYGMQVFNSLYSEYVYSFDSHMQEKIKTLFTDMPEIYNRTNQERAHLEFILQGMLFRMFDFILNNCTMQDVLNVSSSEVFASPLSGNMIDAMVYMENHYAENPPITAVSEVAGLSASYFSRLFHKQFGKTYSEYLDGIKLRHAAALLSNTGKSVTEIALLTGYCNGKEKRQYPAYCSCLAFPWTLSHFR